MNIDELHISMDQDDTSEHEDLRRDAEKESETMEPTTTIHNTNIVTWKDIPLYLPFGTKAPTLSCDNHGENATS